MIDYLVSLCTLPRTHGGKHTNGVVTWERSRGVLTVSELIKGLQSALAQHGDMPVEMEGCDCY